MRTASLLVVAALGCTNGNPSQLWLFSNDDLHLQLVDQQPITY